MSSKNRAPVPEHPQPSYIQEFSFYALIALSILCATACGRTNALSSGQNVQSNTHRRKLVPAVVPLGSRKPLQTISHKEKRHFRPLEVASWSSQKSQPLHSFPA